MFLIIIIIARHPIHVHGLIDLEPLNLKMHSICHATPSILILWLTFWNTWLWTTGTNILFWQHASFSHYKEYLCWGVWEITYTVIALTPILVILHHKCLESLKNTPETTLPTTILLEVMVGCMIQSSTLYAPPSLLPCFPKAKRERNFSTWRVPYAVSFKSRKYIKPSILHICWIIKIRLKKYFLMLTKKEGRNSEERQEGSSNIDCTVLTALVYTLLHWPYYCLVNMARPQFEFFPEKTSLFDNK